MRRMLSLGAALLLVSVSVQAQAPPVGRIGLYIDDSHSSNCVDGTGFYPFEMWIWCQPGELGQICAEFKIDYPSNLVTSTVFPNDAVISVSLGDLAGGISVCFKQCQHDWLWTYHQTIYVTDQLPTKIGIVHHPQVEHVQFANCQPGYPLETVDVISDILVNCSMHTPELLGAEAPEPETVIAFFSKPLDAATAEDPANYEIFRTDEPSETVPVTGAALQASGTDVVLSLGEPLPNLAPHTLRVTGVEDEYGHPVAPGSEATFAYGDDVPPGIAGVTVESDTVLVVLFTEPVDSADASDTGSYTLREQLLPQTVPVASAQLQGDSVTVRLFLGSPLLHDRAYMLSVSNVRDIAGNTIPYGSSRIVPDVFPPEPTGIRINSLAELELTFSERVEYTTGGDESNYTLHVTGDTLDTVGISDAVRLLDNTIVRLSLAEPLAHGTGYTLRIEDVEDIAGNPVSPGTQILFAVVDSFPPVPLSTGRAAGDTVLVLFDELLDPATAGDAGNFAIVESADTTASVAVTAAALRPDSASVELALADTLDAATDYTLRISGIEDRHGNAVPAGTEIAIREIDPPALVEAWYDAPYAYARFDEAIDETSAEDPANYLLRRTEAPFHEIGITSAVLQSNNRVRLALSEALEPATEYLLRATGVADAAGNVDPAGCEITFVTDAEPFTLRMYEQTGTISAHAFESSNAAIYGECGTPGPTGWGYDGYDFSTTGGEYYDLFFSDSAGAPLGIGPGDPLPDPVYLTIECMDLDAGSHQPESAPNWGSTGSNIDAVVVDFAAFDLISVSVAGAVYGLCDEPLQYKRDRFAWNALGAPDGAITMMGCGFSSITVRLADAPSPPVLSGIQIEEPGGMRLSFSRTLDQGSAEETGNYAITRVSEPGDTVRIAGASLAAPAAVDLLFEAPVEYDTVYALRVEGVEDDAGTPVPPGTELVFAFIDDIPPELVFASRLDSFTVAARFSEQVEGGSGTDPGNYYLEEKYDDSQVITTASASLAAAGDSVTLMLADTLDVGTSYTLVVQNVADLHGNAIGGANRYDLVESVLPEIVDVNGDALDFVRVYYSEPMSAAGSYVIHPSGDSTAVVDVAWIDFNSGDTVVRVNLTPRQLTSGVTYTLKASGARDRDGNEVSPGTAFEFTPWDWMPPMLLSAEAEDDFHVLLAFSERLDPVTSQTAAHYTVYEAADTGSTLGVTGAVLQGDGDEVVLTLAGPIEHGITYQVRVESVEDITGNVIEEGATADFTIYGGATGYIGLYTDAAHSVNTVYNPGGFIPFEMWIWCLPGENGQICAEFAIQYPANVITSTVTQNDDIISVLLGDLDGGMSVCYNECQHDWNWPFRQLIYLIDTAPSQITIIPHPDAGAYQFANCLVGYPVEPVTICSSIYINQGAGEPTLLGAQAAGPSAIDVLFSDAVEESTAETIGNYRVYVTGDPADTLEILSAVRLGSLSAVRLGLGEQMTYWTSYTVRVSNVENYSGVPIAANSEIAFNYLPDDQTPPEIVSASIAPPDAVGVLFSEPVDPAAAGDPASYLFYPLGDSASALTITGAVLEAGGDSVSLSTAEPLSRAIDYELHASGLADSVGNLITAAGGTFIIYETVPPSIDTVVVETPSRLLVLFDEMILPATAVPGNFYVHAAGDSADGFVTLIAVQAGSDDAYRIVLDGALAAGGAYRLRVEGIMDTRMNEVEPGTGYDFIVEDDWPPVIVEAHFVSASAVSVLFDEKLDPSTAEDEGNYVLHEEADSLHSIDVIDASLGLDSMAVDLTLASAADTSESWVLRVTGVQDRTGNTVADGTLYTIREKAPPTLLSAVPVAGDTVLVTFSEPLDPGSAADADNYELYDTADTTDWIWVKDADLSADGASVRILLDLMLQQGHSYTVRVNGVRDLAGNEIVPNSTTAFLFEDIYPPELVLALPAGSDELSVFFDEPVDTATALDPGNYLVYPAGNPGGALPITGTDISIGGSRIVLFFGGNLTTGTWTVSVSNVEDRHGNVIPPGSKINFDYTDLPAQGCIGLYADSGHSSCTVQNPGGFLPFELWIWCLPGENGQICAEFAIEYPANVITSTVTDNTPIISVSLGELPTGISVCYTECQQNWHWCYHQACYLTDMNPASINVVPHPDVGVYQLASCLPGYPIEPMILMNNLYLNHDPSPPPATLLRSSGASYEGGKIRISWTLSDIDDGVEFFVSRSHGGENAFVEPLAVSIERDGLSFSFVDGDIEPGASYRYRIEYGEEGGGRRLLFETDDVATPALPLTLYQNRPNPFNPSTTIEFYLPEVTHVLLEIFDVSGRRIRCLERGTLAAGHHEAIWDGRDEAGREVSSGIYPYRLVAGKEVLSRKMVLLR